MMHTDMKMCLGTVSKASYPQKRENGLEAIVANGFPSHTRELLLVGFYFGIFYMDRVVLGNKNNSEKHDI